MKKLYTVLACLAALMPITSCDDFLDVRPKGEKVEDDLFSDASGFEDAIYGVYGSLADASLYGRDLVWGIPEVLSQDLECNSSVMMALARYEYTSNDDLRERLAAIWTKAYASIGYANNVLQNLEKKSPSDLPLYNLYKGEMLGVRAMLHFDMLRLFASTDPSARGIPYVETYNFSVKPFLTVGEATDKIIGDLITAEGLLEDDEDLMVYPRNNDEYDRFNNWRETHFNVYAVRALLARVYYYTGDYANAAIYARKVIDSERFPLVDVTEIQTYLAGVLSPKETIFGIYSPQYLDISNTYLYNHTSYVSYNPYDDITGSTHLLPWTTLYNMDVTGTVQDFRRTHFVQTGGIAKCLKLVDYLAIENDGVTTRSDLIAGLSLIHSSEMYLIAAESLLDTNYDAAFRYFNDEIQSRGLTPLLSTETLTHERIYNEYHKELFCEGQNWFNMKRLNRDIISNFETRTIPASDDIYVIPVPEEEFEYRQ